MNDIVGFIVYQVLAEFYVEVERAADEYFSVLVAEKCVEADIGF